MAEVGLRRVGQNGERLREGERHGERSRSTYVFSALKIAVLQEKESQYHYYVIFILVGVSDIFYFFCSGEGKRESEALGVEEAIF